MTPIDPTNPFPPFDGVEHVSSALRDMIAGTHDLTTFTHAERVERLYALAETYAAMQRIGWVEHTCDWDWYVGVTLAAPFDGTRLGDIEHADPLTDDDDAWSDESRLCDTFRLDAHDALDGGGHLPHTVVHNAAPRDLDFANGHPAITNLVLTMFDGTEYRLDIDTLASITISER